MKLVRKHVHLDFHTSEHIEGIGAEFSKENFQEALKAGHVDSITIFAKCHHGWAYHNSEVNEMHPHLSFDLLKEQIEAAHEIGVETPVYLSAGLDEKSARKHPEWLVRLIDEKTTWVPDFTVPGYHKLCMNTPYLEYLAQEVEEVCKNYDADGIFLDICVTQPCYCRKCVEDRRALGIDPYDPVETLKFAEGVFMKYAKRIREAVDKYKPGLPLFHNCGHIRQGRRDIAAVNTHLEIESLPTGGWGYDHFPFSARYCQGLGMEFLGMTGKFHTRWGEFGGFKHPNALVYETCLSACQGAKCSIGDQLAPNGKMDMVTYNLIGNAYAKLEEKEPWLGNETAVSDVAVLSAEAYTGSFSTGQAGVLSKISKGAGRILLEGKYLFDVIDYESDLSKYKVVILPDIVRIDKDTEKKLKAFCKNGGKILATGKSGLSVDKDEFCIDLGAKWECENPYVPDYFRPVAEIPGMGDTGYVMYEQGEKVQCTGTELGKREDTYFNRTREHFCSHRHTPSSGVYGGGGMTEGKDGIYIAWPVFTDYANKGSISLKQMVCFALDRLLGDEKTLSSNLPAQGVNSVMKQGDRYICHFLYAAPVKRGENTEIIEDLIPIYGVNAKVRLPITAKRVYLAPQKEDIPFVQNGNEINFTVDKLDCHQMVVIE